MELPVAPTRILQQGRWPWNYQGDDPSYALSAAVNGSFLKGPRRARHGTNVHG